MPLAVAEHLVANLTDRSGVVLDPMMGSGTSLLAASKLGRKAQGFDMDPLCVTLTRGLLHSASPQRLLRKSDEIFEAAQAAIHLGEADHELQRLPRAERQFADFWFPKKSQRQLAALSAAIRKHTRGDTRHFFWSVFSSIIIVKSAGPSYALDLARSRPHRSLHKEVVFPFDRWFEKCERAARAHDELWNAAESSPYQASLGDARDLPVPRASIDFVLTSPPYLHGIDYIRAHKFALVWMGAELQTLREVRGSMIGAERGLFVPDGLPRSIEARVTAAEKSTTPRTRRYLADMLKVLREMSRVLKPGGLAVMVVGPQIISNRYADAEMLFKSLGERVGLQTVHAESRNLSSRRRSLPPPHIVAEHNTLSNRLRRETFLVFQK